MKNIRVKMYVTPKELEKIWPQNNVVYTIECYTSGRTWSDNVLSLVLFLGISHLDYLKAMKGKFDCAEHRFMLFFRTKKDCEGAIETLESLQILHQLSK